MTQPKLWCPRMARRFMWIAGLLLGLGLLVVSTRAQERKHSEPAGGPPRASDTFADGRQVFESRCSGCHGLDGRGGERAPDVATMQKTQQRSDAELAQIIEKGVPAGGMPAFPMLDDSEVGSVIGYVRLLQGNTRNAKPPGDPQNGRVLFSSKARCSECHMAQREGGFIASDLSSFGRTHSIQEIREAITKPSSASRLGGAVTVTARDGQKYSGVVRNEDNFSLQLQTLDGAFHLFMKADVDGVMREPNSLMPLDYGATLSAGELNDLISFLLVAASDGNSGTASHKKSTRDEDDQ